MTNLLLCAALVLGSRTSLTQAQPVLREAWIVEQVVNATRVKQLNDLEVALTKLDIDRALATYDQLIYGATGYRINKNQQANAVFGTRTDTLDAQMGYRKTFSTGTALDVGIRQQRITSDSAFFPLSPAYDTVISLSVRQPLLRDFLGEIPRNQVALARSLTEVTRLQAQRLMDTHVLQALETYWSWVSTRDEIVALKQGVERSRSLLAFMKRKRKLGLAHQSEVLLAQISLSRQEEVLRSAQEAEKTQCLLIWQSLELPSAPCKTEETLTPTWVWTSSHPSSWRDYLQHRSDLMAFETSEHALGLQEASARSQARPGLDLSSSLQFNGVQDEVSRSLEESASLGNPNFFIGLELTLPLSARAPKLEKRRVAILQEKLQVQKAQAYQDSINALETLYREHSNTVATHKALKQVFALESQRITDLRRDYDVGRVDGSEVIRAQTELARTQQQLVNTSGLLEILRVRLDFLTGGFRRESSRLWRQE